MKREKVHNVFVFLGATVIGIIIPLFLLGKALRLAMKWEWLMSLTDGIQAVVLMAIGLILVGVSGFLVGKYLDSFYE